MSESETEQDGVEQKGVTVSTMLSSARETLGLSQKEVADQLYLTTAVIKHIDEGAFEKFPKPAFVKGYLRNYARAVEISGDEVVACYEQALQEADESLTMGKVTEEAVGSVAITGPVFQTGLVGLFGVIVVVAMVWWIVSAGDESEVQIPLVTEAPQITAPPVTEAPQMSAPQITDTSQASTEPERDVVMNTLAEPSQRDSDPASTSDSTSNNSSANPTVRGPASVDNRTTAADATGAGAETRVETNVGAIESDISIERHQDAGINYVTVDANGFDELDATFLDDCWLQVEDGNGDSVYGDLNKAGDVLRIYGVSPFKLIVGRAAAINLTFNGDDIDLEGFTAADETAILTLTRKR